MKVTVDLPPDLVRQLKLRAIEDGLKLKDSVASILRSGLRFAGNEAEGEHPTFFSTDATSGLPVIHGRNPVQPGQELTPERIAQILHDQEVEWSKS